MDDVLKGKIFQQGESADQPSAPPPPQPEPPSPVPTTPISSPVQPAQESQPENVFIPHQPTINPMPPPPSQPPPVKEESPKGAPKFNTLNIVKIFIGFFAVVALLFIVFGVVMPNLTKKEEKVELTFWDVSNNSTISSVLPNFEKQNPNIKVKYEKEDIKDYKDRLVTRSNNGTGPDVFRFHSTWVLQLSDILLPIPSDVLSREDFNKNYYPVVKHDLLKGGAIYGIPIEADTLSLYVNSALLKQNNVSAPTNWNDFITVSRALTLKDENGKIKVAGSAMGTFDNITHAPDIFSLLFVQDGVKPDDISIDKTRVADALRFYTAFAQGDGSVWDNTLEPSITAFSKGNLAMFFGYFKDQATINSANPNLSFEVLSVPHLAGQNTTIASYYPMGVSLKSKHQKEALKLLQFLSQKDIAERLTNLPLARTDLPDRSKGQTKDSVSTYFSGETFDNGLNTKMNSQLSSAITSILSGGSIESSADSLVLGFSQILNQFLPKP